MFLKIGTKDVRIVERISLQWLNRKKYIVKGVWKMDEQKKELINILQNINNPKMINYLLNFIKTFLEIRR